MIVEQKMHRFLSLWGDWILRRPVTVLLAVLLLTGGAAYYAANHLSVNTDTAELIAPDAPFQQNRRKFEKEFDQFINSLLLVVESETPELTASAAKRLSRLLNADKEHFKSVYIPNDSVFFHRNGLLYLETGELEDLSQSLAQAQPFIGRLAENNSLEGLFSILQDALEHSDKEKDLPIETAPLLNKIRQTLHKIVNGENALLSWQQLMLEKNPELLGPNRGFILVAPKYNFDEIMPLEKAVNTTHAAIAKIQDANLPPVKVWITGEVGLEHDEMAGISKGTFTASLFSLGLVCIILLIAFRSVYLMLATLITLMIGMVFCGAFASVAVKELNLISVAFAVSNIGLGVEYAIHFCLRYRDYLKLNIGREKAIRGTLLATSPSLLLCAATTAIGLYAFIPTDYKGISELGLLAGSSLFICLFITLTVLPALLRIIPAPHFAEQEMGHTRFKPLTMKLATIPLHYAKPIVYITAVLAVLSGFALLKLQVDFNPLNIRDPNTESVIAFKKLLKTQDTSPMTLTVLSSDAEKTKRLQNEIEKLQSVDKTVSLFDFIPGEQEEKLAILEDLNLVFGSQAKEFPDLKVGTDPKPAIEKFLAAIATALPKRIDRAEITALTALQKELQDVLIELDNRQEPSRQLFVEKMQSSVIGALPTIMNKFLAGLQAGEVALDSIPADIKDRWLSKNGTYRIQIFPKKDLNDLKNLEQFITEVQAVEQDATDLPVMYWESMKVVMNAFKQAFTIALITIAVILWVMRRNLKDTLLVVIPLSLGGLFTMASTALTGTPINFANIIALPLLLGLGVDNGIHMLEKLRHSTAEEQNIYQSSTARGIFYGALTTVSSFAGLAFSPHQGIASMGLVITIGIFWVMIGTFVILPAMSKLVLK
jgi:hopanoid biosynthesis associated RND transporter like protein HpnN